MAVCTTCGKSFSVIGNSCPHCHAPLTIEGVKSKKQTESYKGDYDGKSQNLLLLSAFIPLFGFVYWYIKREEYPLRSASSLQGALMGTIGYLILITFSLIIRIF